MSMKYNISTTEREYEYDPDVSCTDTEQADLELNKSIGQDSQYRKDDEVEDEDPATWGEVFRSCCTHTYHEWVKISGILILIIFFLYFFLFGLDLLGSSAKVVGGCTAGSLFGDDQNPVVGVMIGMLITVILQSSSTTTSIVVSMVGAESISIKAAIYMVMGANIGTSVTNTIVALGQMGDGDQLERAFSGATVHDMFNFLCVATLFPIEVITHYLYYFTKIMLPNTVDDGDKWEGPIKKLVSPLTKKIIIPNKSVTKNISLDISTCSSFYPTECVNDIIGYNTCNKSGGTIGLISCDKKTNDCPFFFKNGATKTDDMVSGGVCLLLSIFILVGCLICLITILQKLLLGVSSRVLKKASNINGYLGIVIGCAITLLVQSSSITTSTLTPLVGLDVINLNAMFPLTLGANIGTTFTGLLAALVSSKRESLQVALCHVFFNITGIIIWYPFPFLRRIPIKAAQSLGKATKEYGKLFPVFYIIGSFIIAPLILFGISSLFEQGSRGFTVLGSFMVIIIAIVIVYGFIKWYKLGGREQFHQYTINRKRKLDAIKNLVNDMDNLKSELSRVKEENLILAKNFSINASAKHDVDPQDEVDSQTDDIEVRSPDYCS